LATSVTAPASLKAPLALSSELFQQTFLGLKNPGLTRIRSAADGLPETHCVAIANVDDFARLARPALVQAGVAALVAGATWAVAEALAEDAIAGLDVLGALAALLEQQAWCCAVAAAAADLVAIAGLAEAAALELLAFAQAATGVAEAALGEKAGAEAVAVEVLAAGEKAAEPAKALAAAAAPPAIAVAAAPDEHAEEIVSRAPWIPWEAGDAVSAQSQ